MNKEVNILLLRGYSNIELIGQGAISQVFKATKENKIFAVKILTSKTIGGNQNRYWKNEIEIITQLQKNLKASPCPYITQIYDVFQENESAFIVNEYCDQGDLYNFIQKCHQHLNHFSLAIMMKQLIEGIIYLHERKIIHRDLKPENILVAYQDNVYVLKITDFGISSQDELTKSQVGTVNYMAPEIIRSQQYDKSVDIWSFGCIAYEIITNEQLFQAQSQFEVARKIINFQYQSKHFINQDLFEIIEQCLQVDQNKRITSDAILDKLNNIINKYMQIPQQIDEENRSQSIEEYSDDDNNSEGDAFKSQIDNRQQRNQSINQTQQSIKPNNLQSNITSICPEEAIEDLKSSVKSIRLQQKEENILSLLKQINIQDKQLEKGTYYYILYQNELQNTDKQILQIFIFLIYTLIEGGLVNLKEFSSGLNLTQSSEEIELQKLLNFCLVNCIFQENQTQNRFQYLIKDLLRKKVLQQAFQNICKKKSEQILELFKKQDQISYETFKKNLTELIPRSKISQCFYSVINNKTFQICGVFSFTILSFYLIYKYYPKNVNQKFLGFKNNEQLQNNQQSQR
ncbi:Serine/Threonine kinase domain protein (macronuclear) [Tetrahymena thermophila SB210]|uniref:Serine/Threonine kinase domain protein n=1 Tax=Tetrahymena thermophila (strain SB210) TaxID=312017 RepID=I7M1D3_TETTS|nr:Serine/Threonine kinase domain protein [Tetrahymena thermophila SB210]EAR96108.2 Serine/Threonine kinase domain protein [Tetrahymena thermophila SB210]|eukprot:XP_001016353.2 Serine/Threonine kinase domain protein [Tetrahymena thermophila SB210]